MDSILRTTYEYFLNLDEEIEGEKSEFINTLKKYNKQFNYLSQLIQVPDKYYIYLNIFLKRLDKIIAKEETDNSSINVDNLVELQNIMLEKMGNEDIYLEEKDGEVSSPGLNVSGGQSEEEKLLSDIVDNLNAVYGADMSLEETDKVIEKISSKATQSEDAEEKAIANNEDAFERYFIDNNFCDILDNIQKDSNDFYDSVMKNDNLCRQIGKLVAKSTFKYFNESNSNA